MNVHDFLDYRMEKTAIAKGTLDRLKRIVRGDIRVGEKEKRLAKERLQQHFLGKQVAETTSRVNNIEYLKSKGGQAPAGFNGTMELARAAQKKSAGQAIKKFPGAGLKHQSVITQPGAQDSLNKFVTSRGTVKGGFNPVRKGQTNQQKGINYVRTPASMRLQKMIKEKVPRLQKNQRDQSRSGKFLFKE